MDVLATQKSIELTANIPEDLRGAYRYGLTEDDLAPYPQKLKDLLGFRDATIPEMNHYRIQRAVGAWGRFGGDTGSTEVQGMDKYVFIFSIRCPIHIRII